MDLYKHAYRVGIHSKSVDQLPGTDEELGKFISDARKHIEPWLSAIFQAEHLNLLLGSGFTAAIASIAGTHATGMNSVQLGTVYDAEIMKHADESAKAMGRGIANVEDQLRSAITAAEGLKVLLPDEAPVLTDAIDRYLTSFLSSLLETESGIANTSKSTETERTLQSFLLSFASRAASRERLHLFTTNYDRLVEHGCDLAGLRTIDRFVGALNPVFRATRIEVDMHYNPPGIRGEPRFMEGVIRLTKLHGSLDWFFDKARKSIFRKGIPFGAPALHTEVPIKPIETMMIYPNPAKDVETTEYPYAELFRDFAAAVCRPNAVLVTYGYGFGDDHVNRVLSDMLKVPSTHLVIIARSASQRIVKFCNDVVEAQVTLLIGHFASIDMLVENYLPKPAIDHITGRMTDVLNRRPATKSEPVSDGGGSLA